MSCMASNSTATCQSARGASIPRSVYTPQVVLARQATKRNISASAAQDKGDAVTRMFEIAKQTTVAFAAAATIGLQAPALGADQTLRLPISGDKKIAQVQEVMLETWAVVGDSFFDGAALVSFACCLSTDSNPLLCDSGVRLRVIVSSIYAPQCDMHLYTQAACFS